MMDVLVLGRFEIAAVEQPFDSVQKIRVGREHIDKLAVRRTRLSHQDLATLFNDLRLDLARMRIF